MARRASLHSIKQIVEGTTLTAATTDTVVSNFATTIDVYSLATAQGIPAGAHIGNIYFSVFAISEDGEAASQLPLIDWYVGKFTDSFGAVFDANNLPSPGTTGTHQEKSKIFHTEKGLSGVSLSSSSSYGNAMVSKGVIRVPKRFRRMASGDVWKFCMTTNFITKVCFQFIYKHYY